MPALMEEEVTATYAGLRAAIDADDYLIDLDAAPAVPPRRRHPLDRPHRRPGRRRARDRPARARPASTSTVRDDLPDPPRMPNLGEAGPRPYQDAGRIAADPAYGHIVCFCERVTSGEIRDACRSTIPPVDLDGLRRRTRALNGRCQGFYCGARVRALLGTAGAEAPEEAP